MSRECLPGGLAARGLNGRPPFEGDQIGVPLRRVEAGEWRPRAVNKDVPAPLAAVCRKAMALRPGDRYGAALEPGAELERWLADEPVTAWREPLRLRAADVAGEQGRRRLGRRRPGPVGPLTGSRSRP